MSYITKQLSTLTGRGFQTGTANSADESPIDAYFKVQVWSFPQKKIKMTKFGGVKCQNSIGLSHILLSL